jgi:cytochrome c oxidase assembly protein subunit 15
LPPVGVGRGLAPASTKQCWRLLEQGLAPTMAESQNATGVHRLAIATTVTTVALLVAGALVTSNDAADSVPDWPLAYGRIIPPLIGGIRYEYAHRVVAALVLILTTILAIWLSRATLNSPARRWGWMAFALVLVQAFLGRERVLFGHAPVIATIHATIAQVFFITIVSLTLFTSAWWQRDLVPLDDSGSPRLRSLSSWTTSAILVQLALGAGFRHRAFGVLPHLVGAVAVLFLAVWTSRTVRVRFGQVTELRRGGILLQASLGTQILLGFAAYWAVAESLTSAQPVLLYVIVEVAHVVVGALTLAASVLLTLSSFRLIRSATSAAATTSAEKARA